MSEETPNQPEVGVSGSGLGRRLGAVALGAAVLLTILVSFHKLWATDLWWQYKAGQYIAQHGFPTVDVFSYALDNEPWVELRWIFVLVQYQLMETFGPTSLIVAKTLAVLLAFGLVLAPVVRRDNLSTAGFVLAVAGMAASLRFLVRPEFVSWLFAALFVFILSRYRENGSRWIWALPLIQVLWVNSHTLFVFGPLLIGLLLFVTVMGPAAVWVGLALFGGFALAQALDPGLVVYIAGAAIVAAWAIWLLVRRLDEWMQPEIRRQWTTLGSVLVLCLLAGFVNPWGFEGFRVPFDQFLQISDSAYAGVLTEYQSPLTYLHLTPVVQYLILIGLVALSTLLNLKRLDPFWLLFCTSQLLLSMIAVRNVPLFCLAALPFTVQNLDRSELLQRAGEGLRRRLQIGFTVATLLWLAWYAPAIVTDRYSLRQLDSNQFGAGFAEHRYPFESFAFIEEHKLEGRIFATLLEAAYVLSQDRQIFADPRGDVYPDAKLEEFLRAMSSAAAWQEAVQTYDIRIALLDLRSGLVPILRRVGGWEVVTIDTTTVVFVRSDSLGDVDPIDTESELQSSLARLRERLPRPTPYADVGFFGKVTIPNPYFAMADFLYAMHRPIEAGEWLDDAAAASPFLTNVEHRRTAYAELLQDWPKVIRHAHLALQETPGDLQVLNALGAAYFRQGDFDNAKHWLEEAVRAQPERAQTWALLGELAVVRQDLPTAIADFRKAVELAPRNPGYRGNLARAKLFSGDYQGAYEDLLATLQLDPNNIPALHDLAQMFIQNGDAAQARPVHDRAWGIAPDHPLLSRQRQELEALEGLEARTP